MTDASNQTIGEVLHLEHLHTLAFANALEARIFEGKTVPLDPGDAADAAFIDDLVATIEADIHRHFRFEEEVLFPRVNEAGLKDVTAMLVEEHAMIRRMAGELNSLAVAARRELPTPAQWTQFRDTAMDFIHASMFHIQKEEMSVIRTLSVTLGDDTARQLAADYAAFGSDTPATP